MAIFRDIKFFQQGGLDQDSAIEYISKNDYLEAFNIRVTGTMGGEQGYVTNIESTASVSPYLAPSIGLNKCIGFQTFPSIRVGIGFIYNSAGYNQIIRYDYDTNTQQSIYTDQISSASANNLLNLNPDNYVQIKLVNDTFLAWADGQSEVGFTNLTTLTSGGYGKVLQEDLSLIKPQNLIPPTGVYGNDAGVSSNFLKGKLFQFTSQYVGFDFTYSTWSTWSNRIIPPQESTPIVGTDVTQNNFIIVSVFAGSIRVKTLNVATRYGLFDYNIIKSVDRSYITALPNTSVDVTNQIYESYNPATNIYSFAFYNNTLNIAVPPLQIDQIADYIYPSNALEVINGNILTIGDLKLPYERPAVQVLLRASGYNPNITVPSGANTDPLYISYIDPGGPGSGLGNHKRYVQLNFLGTPQTGDIITIVLYNIQDANNTQTYTYTVTAATSGNLLNTIGGLSGAVPNSSYRQDTASAQVILGIITDPYFTLQSATVTIFNAGATVSKSIHAILDNSSYQLALAHYDIWGRPFPLDTDNTFIVQTPSFAQLRGNTPLISWQLLSSPPAGAASAQWLITKNNTVISLLDTFGSLLNYKGGWNAHTNTPTLTVNVGTVGDIYQITSPNLPTDTALNLGNGFTQYDVGDYVVYNGKSWDTVPKEFGDLTSTSSVLAISLNPLNLFNQKWSDNGAETVLGYSFTQGDRCTLHYYIDPATPSTIHYLNSPTVDVDVFGYDASTFLLKIEKSSSVDPTLLAGKNLYLRLYTPNTQKTSGTTTDNTTVWNEIGEQINIVNGAYATTAGNITDGDVYFKTRQFDGGIDPNTLYSVLATDFNFSDFYPSAFTSYGRVRGYYDVLEKTEQKASIIFSEPYILGSRNNGLTRFYQANLYGDGNGQTSSNYGGIQILWQRGDVLIAIQERNVFYIPVNISILEDQAELKQYAISEKLLNNGRYATENIGIGKLKESFDYYNNNGFFVDPNRSEPVRIEINGVRTISGKNTKYFRSVIQSAVAEGKKIVGYYSTYYNEYVISIALNGNNLLVFPFSATNWNLFDNNVITPSEIISLSSDANFSASYNPITGIATFTPMSTFIGNDVSVFTFGSPSVQKNICLNWVAASTVVNQFSFAPQIGQPLSTLITSNVISVQGNQIAVPISITGGSYSVNGGAFTSSPGMVNFGDSVQVEVLSSASNNTSTSCTLTISGTSGTFTVTTYSLIAGILVVDIDNEDTGNFCGYINTPGATIPYQVPVFTGQNFMPGSSTPAAQNWCLASDVVHTSIAWRFEFNITQLVATYPSEPTFVFIISGRSVSPSSLNGQYITKSTTGSVMTMSGSPGTYLPSATGPNVGNVPYSGRTTVGGADGTYGVGVGAVIMTFTYTVSTNTLVLT